MAEELSLDIGAWTLVRDGVAAVLFMQGVMTSTDAMSALNSSPWTSETFGASPEKAASSRNYVRQSVILSTGVGLIASAVGRSWWPLVGITATNAYLFCLYERALAKGAKGGSTGWGQ